MVGHAAEEGASMSSPFERNDQVEGTNRIVRHNGCTTCDGHRMIMVSDEGAETWAPCPKCNAAPLEPVDTGTRGRWWEE